MEEIIYFIVEAVIALAAGFGLGYIYHRYTSEKKTKSAEALAEEIIADAKAESKNLTVQAKEEALKLRNSAEEEITRKRKDLDRQEERLQKRHESLDKRLENLERRERVLNKRQSQIDKKSNEVDKLSAKRMAELERVSAMTRDEAKEELLAMVEADARQDIVRVIRQVEADTKEEADRKAREIIVMAMQRVASDQVSETVVSAVPLPSDDMKGRIIGRQGRNIRAFENATGVDVIVDDTPEAIILSGFD